ncbi:MAG TPA: leucine-rich repeat protein [Acholeplasmataceae bacterium]|nr:leucine-rich repeat protein [Acholeplasmataceae bacterium]
MLNSLSPIGYGAFSNCQALEILEIPESVLTIEESVFVGCKKVKKP